MPSYEGRIKDLAQNILDSCQKGEDPMDYYCKLYIKRGEDVVIRIPYTDAQYLIKKLSKNMRQLRPNSHGEPINIPAEIPDAPRPEILIDPDTPMPTMSFRDYLRHLHLDSNQNVLDNIDPSSTESP